MRTQRVSDVCLMCVGHTLAAPRNVCPVAPYVLKNIKGATHVATAVRKTSDVCPDWSGV